MLPPTAIAERGPAGPYAVGVMFQTTEKRSTLKPNRVRI